jgi:DNA-binding NarL/FixJ family response regulator
MSGSVFVVDPQLPFRAGLRFVLEAGGTEVVGEAPIADGAVDEIVELRPDVCVIGGDDIGSIAATQRLIARVPGIRIVLLVGKPTQGGLMTAVRAGVVGYLPRDTAGASLARVVRAVMAGEYAIPRLGIADVIDAVRGDGRRRLAIGGVPVSLTAREGQVFDLLADGRSTEEIATSLDVSPVTVRRHVGAIGEKAGRPGRRLLLKAI